MTVVATRPVLTCPLLPAPLPGPSPDARHAATPLPTPCPQPPDAGHPASLQPGRPVDSCTDTEAEQARLARRCIIDALHHQRDITIATPTTDAPHPAPLTLPASVLPLLAELLAAVADHRPLPPAPPPHELTTVEAAHFLNVSRPALIQAMATGCLPFRKVGALHYIGYEDLVAYRGVLRSTQDQPTAAPSWSAGLDG